MLAWQRFSAWRLAQQRFGIAFDALSPAQRHALQPALARQWRLEHAVAEAARQQLTTQPQPWTLAVTDALAAEVRQVGLTEPEYQTVIEHHALMEWQMAQISAQALPPSRREVVTWYQQHQARFFRPEQRLTRHLLLTTGDDDGAIVLSDILKLHQQIQRDTPAFAAFAERYSQCPTALEGGRLGWVSRGLLYASLEQVLFTLSVGEVSEPVASDMGWHLLLCEAVRPAKPMARQQALAKVYDSLLLQRQREQQRQWLAALLPDER